MNMLIFSHEQVLTLSLNSQFNPLNIINIYIYYLKMHLNIINSLGNLMLVKNIINLNILKK